MYLPRALAFLFLAQAVLAQQPAPLLLDPIYALLEVKRSFQSPQARLFAVAQSQGGYFTAKQAEEAGFDRTNHAYHVRAQNWQREYRGIFWVDALSGAGTPRPDPFQRSGSWCGRIATWSTRRDPAKSGVTFAAF